jgi:hypothetical protein
MSPKRLLDFSSHISFSRLLCGLRTAANNTIRSALWISVLLMAAMLTGSAGGKSEAQEPSGMVVAVQASHPQAWLVQTTSGSVSYTTPGAALKVMEKGVLLHEGSIVQTGENGKVLLVRGEESIFVGPFTLAMITPTASKSETVIILHTGRAEFEVRKQDSKHFTVQTPYLAAVVKGTKFSVAVEPSFADVTVTEGLVEVSSGTSGIKQNVAPGQHASVDSRGKFSHGPAEGASRERAQPKAGAFPSFLDGLFNKSKFKGSKKGKRSAKRSRAKSKNGNFYSRSGHSHWGTASNSGGSKNKGGWSGGWGGGWSGGWSGGSDDDRDDDRSGRGDGDDDD